MKDLERRAKDLNTQFKQAVTDTLTLQLFKDAQRVEYIAFAILKLIHLDLTGKAELQTLMSFALKFLQQNTDVLIDLLTNQPLTPQTSKAMPFSKNQGSKKTLLKQNIQLSIGYLRKICRQRREDKFTDLITLLNRIDSHSPIQKVREQVRRIMQREEGRYS